MLSNSKRNKSETPLQNKNSIAKHTKVIGDLNTQGDLRVDGTIEGNIKSTGKVVIGKTGHVEGILVANDAHIEGQFVGHLTLSGTLSLSATASVEGEVITSKLAVELGTKFNATCVMKETLKTEHHGGRQDAKPQKTT